MTLEEAKRHVGAAVWYRPHPGDAARPGVIHRISTLVLVAFTDHDGGILQVNPHCLELAGEPPTLKLIGP